METLIRLLVGLLPVVVFLLGLIYLDSFKLVGIRTVLAAIVAGIAAAGVAYLINRELFEAIGQSLKIFSRYVAPIVEEVLQAAVLAWFIRTHRVGFLVDAAILGFAIGTGFALIENVYYFRVLGESTLAVWIIRGFGTALMHGGTTAIFGLISKTLVDRYRMSFVAFLPGLVAAILMHSAFNHFFLSPILLTLIVLVSLPLLIALVFHRSETALRSWIGVGFDADAELLRLIESGQFSESKIGGFLQSLRDHFSGEVVVDMLCYLRLHTELSLRAKGELMMREMGFKTTLEPETREKFEEMKYLEASIGRTGRLALTRVFHVSPKTLWQLYMLERK